MNINEVKDLMTQFDGSSLREFSWRTAEGELSFSKNENKILAPAAAPVATAETKLNTISPASEKSSGASTESDTVEEVSVAEGEAVKSPLVGVAYLKPAPEKPEFIAVGDAVKKGQTLLIIEAMKVMNEIPAPKDGVVTEIMVNAEDVVEFGQELVRIK